ncbi:tyrosine-type recombinase/integrase [Murimonas intestini]|uniref:Site-specific recombinase XerD n=1 Tax=Murimonas intestini TaxID=1337051 RepID=A0AB73T8D4_9FIRM|nr:site-specific integrase [Murimonas intestini]MCR1839800.1 site-specific integrase [Murimonas intestini]MCR1866642.1 site-specific integrase [Murimonas intestini]MCR1883475.1 site-specific integrase [Murimonas intestini]
MYEKMICRVGHNELKAFVSYLREQERAEATISKYLTDMNTFLKFIGEDSDADRRKLLDYKEWLKERYAVSSANSMIAALNSFLEFQGLSVMKIKSFKIQKKMFLEKEMTNKEYRNLVDSAQKKGKHQLALIMESICATGIRISELRYITIESLKKRRIEVNNKGKARIILLPDVLVKKLLYFAGKERIDSGPVFVTKQGNPKNRSNIWAEMKSLSEDTGVDAKKVFPHNLRHLFARTFYHATKNLTALADILGHSSLEVTRIYTADTMAQFQAIINGLGLISDLGQVPC